MAEKLTLKEILSHMDQGHADWWKALDAEQRKQIGFWLLNRYASSIKGNTSDTAMAVLTTNEYYNKNWNVLSTRHAELQWQILCMINEDRKIKFHKYINLKRSSDSNSKKTKLFLKLYPNMKADEAETLAKISTKEQLQQLVQSHGLEYKDFE
jgi:hypothetical protein